MDWSDLLSVLAMAFILEGLMPFILPARWREVVVEIANMPDGRIRAYGGFIMLVGAITLIMARG